MVLLRQQYQDEEYIKRLRAGGLRGPNKTFAEITENDENSRTREKDASWTQKYLINRKLVLIYGKLCGALFVGLCKWPEET